MPLMPDRQRAIEEIFDARHAAITAALLEEAESIVPLTAERVVKELGRAKFARQLVEGITKDQVTAYRAQVEKGGTNIVEKVVSRRPDGTVAVSTRTVFKPWLNDMTDRDRTEVLRIIGEGEQYGLHPKQIAERLETYFEATSHNARTAARTEAQKLRTDARIATYSKTGVKYLEYVAVDDERTRPDHAARNGKIYPIDRAPWLGEPNCRCMLVDADYKVEERGTGVEQDDTVVVPEEVL